MKSLPPRYQFVSQLGEGSMGAVFQVKDLESAQELALKVCLKNDEAARLQFRQEFWAMSTLSHPGLLGVLEQGECLDGRPFFTMPLVEGQDLRGPLSEEQVREWLPQLVAALDYLHGRGYVHGDLKPENLRRRPDGSLVLMDLGLLARTGQSRPIAGTLLYLAPEVALGRAVDGRSDLYALGAVLYELVSGVPLFDAADAASLLRAQVEQVPIRLRERLAQVSEPFDALVMGLLEKNPDKRPPDGLAVLEALGLQAALGEDVRLLVPALSGREALKCALMKRLQTPEGVSVWLFGTKGVGKSRLADEVVGELELGGKMVLRSRISHPEQAPYAALTGALRRLMHLVSPELYDALAPKVAHQLPMEGVEPLQPLEGSAEVARFHDAVASLFEALPSPMIWLIDDAANLGEASRGLVRFLRNRLSDSNLRFLNVSCEPSPAEEEGVLVPALEDSDVLALAASCLHGTALPALAAERMLPFAQGLPAHVMALLQHWVRRKAIARIERRWVVSDAAWLDVPADLAGTLSSLTLAPRAQALAEAVAVLGERGSLGELAPLLDLSLDELFQPLAELEGLGALAVSGGEYHFQALAIVAAVSATMASDRARQLHARRLNWLLRLDRPSLEQRLALMRHALSARDFQAASQAWPDLVAAANAVAALDVLMPMVALGQSQGPLPDVLQAQMEAAQITALRARGQLGEALARCQETILERLRAVHASAALDHLLIRANLKHQKGLYDEAERDLRQCLKEATAGRLGSLAVRARFVLARLRFFRGAKQEAQVLLDEAIAEARSRSLNSLLAGMLSLAGYMAATSGQPDGYETGCRWLAESVALAEETGNLLDLMDAMGNLGNAHATAGRYAEALTAYLGYLDYANRLALPSEAIYASLNLATTAYELCDWDLLETHLASALARSRRDGRRFTEGYALALRGLWRALRGDPREGHQDLVDAARVAVEIGNPYLGEQVRALHLEATALVGGEQALLAAMAEGTPGAEEEGEQAARIARTRAALASWVEPEGYLATLDAAVEAARAAGRVDSAVHLLRWGGSAALACGQTGRARDLMLAAERMLAEGHVPGLAGEVALVHALAAWREGDREGARIQLERIETTSSQHRSALTREQAVVLRGRLDVSLRSEARTARRHLLAWRGNLPAPWDTPGAGGPELNGLLDEEPEELGTLDWSSFSQSLVALAQARGFKQVLSTVACELGRLLQVERAHLILWSEGEVSHSAHWGATRANEMELRLAHHIVWNAAGAFDSEHRIWGLPLIAAGCAWGAAVVSLASETVPSESAQEMASQLLHQSAALLEREKQLADSQAEGEVLRVAYEAATQALACGSRESQQASLARSILSLTGGERVLWLRGEDQDRFACHLAWGPDGVVLPAEEQRFTSGVAAWVFQRGEPMFLMDAQQDEAFRARGSVMALGLRSVFVIPVQQDGTPIGLLYVDLQHVAPQGQEQLQTLSQVGTTFAATLARRNDEAI